MLSYTFKSVCLFVFGSFNPVLEVWLPNNNFLFFKQVTLIVTSLQYSVFIVLRLTTTKTGIYVVVFRCRTFSVLSSFNYWFENYLVLRIAFFLISLKIFQEFQHDSMCLCYSYELKWLLESTFQEREN